MSGHLDSFQYGHHRVCYIVWVSHWETCDCKCKASIYTTATTLTLVKGVFCFLKCTVRDSTLSFPRWSTRRPSCPALFPSFTSTRPTSAWTPPTCRGCTHRGTARRTWISPAPTSPRRCLAALTLTPPRASTRSPAPKTRRCARPNTLSSTHRCGRLAPGIEAFVPRAVLWMRGGGVKSQSQKV